MLKNTDPILLIEDDEDDQKMLQQALEELNLPNRLVTMNDGSQALDYLKSGANPFIILCDMDMPRMDGMELWHRINQEPQLRKKAIPFIFLTSHDDQQDIADAYDKQTVQGFFVKGNDQRQIREILRQILSYWDLCLHPNKRKFKYS